MDLQFYVRISLAPIVNYDLPRWGWVYACVGGMGKGSAHSCVLLLTLFCFFVVVAVLKKFMTIERRKFTLHNRNQFTEKYKEVILCGGCFV